MRFVDVTGFDWDAGNRAKCQKHGVSVAEIEEVFQRTPLILPDRTGSAEPRLNAVSLNAKGRHVFVVLTLRSREGSVLLRPNSACYMHEKEIGIYERTTT